MWYVVYFRDKYDKNQLKVAGSYETEAEAQSCMDYYVANGYDKVYYRKQWIGY